MSLPFHYSDITTTKILVCLVWSLISRTITPNNCCYKSNFPCTIVLFPALISSSYLLIVKNKLNWLVWLILFIPLFSRVGCIIDIPVWTWQVCSGASVQCLDRVIPTSTLLVSVFQDVSTSTKKKKKWTKAIIWMLRCVFFFLTFYLSDQAKLFWDLSYLGNYPSSSPSYLCGFH